GHRLHRSTETTGRPECGFRQVDNERYPWSSSYAGSIHAAGQICTRFPSSAPAYEPRTSGRPSPPAIEPTPADSPTAPRSARSRRRLRLGLRRGLGLGPAAPPLRGPLSSDRGGVAQVGPPLPPASGTGQAARAAVVAGHHAPLRGCAAHREVD